MFGTNITEYDNKKKHNISHSNSLKTKINIIESVLNNIINTNFDSNMNNIFNVYNLKLKELHDYFTIEPTITSPITERPSTINIDSYTSHTNR